MFGEIDDQEFADLKNYNVNPDRVDISWTSNNSIFGKVGMDYSPYVNNMFLNGEPGFAWMENTTKYGRMGEERFDNAIGYNPCKPLYSTILTPNGYVTFEQALEMDSLEVVLPGGKIAKASKPFKTGENREIVRVKLSDGTNLFATGNHLHMTTDDKWISVDEFEIGTELKRVIMPIFDTQVNDVSRYEKGIVAGWLHGDGSLSVSGNKKTFTMAIGVNEFDFEPELVRMTGLTFKPHGQKPHTCRTTSAVTKLAWLLDEGYDSDKNNLEWLYGKDKDFKLGFIRGLFTTDGSVRKNNNVELYSVNYNALEVLVRILQEFGIYSTIAVHNYEKHYIASDGKPRNNKTTYKINVYAGQYTKIGFLTKFKQDLLESINHTTNIRIADKVTVIDIEREYSYEDVYDITVYDESHAFIDSSTVAHNCAEQPLANKEMCLLTEIYIDKHEDMYDFLRTIKFAYLYAKSISLTYEWISDDESRNIMVQNRRIGLSLSGVAQFMTKHGKHKLIKFMDTGYAYTRHYDKHYSEWLGVNESIRVTTQKPAGTVALLAGSTPGIHHPHSEYYIRRIRIASDSNLVKILQNCGFKTEPDAYSANTTVIEFPVFSGDNVPSEKELSIWEQLEITALSQKYWSDNAVSVTIKLDPNKHTPQELKRALELYQYRLKCVSVLPEVDGGAYAQMPYETITKEQYEKMVEPINWYGLANLAAAMTPGTQQYDLYCDGQACVIPNQQ